MISSPLILNNIINFTQQNIPVIVTGRERVVGGGGYIFQTGHLFFLRGGGVCTQANIKSPSECSK